MLRKPLLTLFCALALAAAFFYGVTRLFVLRYEKGDVYPPYSSLRADPLGVKGIYEALDGLSGVEASRNFRALHIFFLSFRKRRERIKFCAIFHAEPVFAFSDDRCHFVGGGLQCGPQFL